MKKAFLSVLSLLIVLSCLSVGAYADGGAELSDGDFIYLGSYGGANVKWRVLDADAMNNGEPGAFLFSEYLVEKYATAYAEGLAVWQDSLAQQWCSRFYDSAFSPAEQAAIPAVSKREEECQLFGLRWHATELDNERVFFISSLELSQFVGDRDGAPGLTGYTADGQAAYYWLRTSHRSHPDYSGLVLEDNQVHDFLVYIVWGAKPAMNLDLTQVLALRPAYEGAQSEWKLLLTDHSAPLSLSGVAVEGDALTAQYSGATGAAGEYISLLIRDGDGKSLSCERLCPAQASGSVSIPLSALSVPEGGQASLVAERDGGDYVTSTASEPAALQSTVSFACGEGSGSMEGMGFTPGIATALPECGFTPPASMRFDHWEMDGQALSGELTVTRDALLTAVYSPIPVASVAFDRAEVEVGLFETVTVAAAVHPQNAADKTLLWSVDDGHALKLKDIGGGCCTVTGKLPGAVTVTAASADGGAVGSFTVNVTGSRYTAYAAAYGPYILVVVALALAAIFLFRKRDGKH